MYIILKIIDRWYLSGEAVYALIVGGVTMGIAALLMLFVDDVDESKEVTIG